MNLFTLGQVGQRCKACNRKYHSDYDLSFGSQKDPQAIINAALISAAFSRSGQAMCLIIMA
jgi:hypothetical protein